ncbi:hypothetical protein GCM10023335_84270 [Streptomyces siamensis]|uniref:Uncharacterized protein n=1 Tax=Streptomyces siamensis TaxID=1274986 RepID=A0ABP9JQ17_9ACTN
MARPSRAGPARSPCFEGNVEAARPRAGAQRKAARAPGGNRSEVIRKEENIPMDAQPVSDAKMLPAEDVPAPGG